MPIIKQLSYVMFHPFDGFYEAKRLKTKRKYDVATLLLVLYGLTQIISYQYSGFIINYNPIFEMNSVRIFILGLFPIILFIISNWSVTSIFNGSGTIGDIYMVVCYALLPKIIFDFIGVILSNFIISEEVSLLMAFTAIGTVWFCFLVFAGLCVVHEYSASMNIAMLVLTFIAAIIIVFFIMLYFNLIGRFINFILTIINEMSKRW